MVVLGYILCFLMGNILGAIGGGGSILTVPILVYFFKVPAVLATSYSLLIVAITSIVGVLSYKKNDLVNTKIAAIFSIPAALGVLISRVVFLPSIPDMLGIWGYNFTKDQLILVIFSLLVIIISFFMFRAKDQTSYSIQKKPRVYYILIGLEGIVVGIITGIVGAGGGFMIVPALIMLAKLDIKSAIATSLLIISAKSFVGFIGDLWVGLSINWIFFSTILVITLSGVVLGTKINALITPSQLRKGFATFVLVMGGIIFITEVDFNNRNRSNHMLNNQEVNAENTVIFNDILVSDLINMQKNNKLFVLLDVRQPEETDEGIIPGATLIPLSELEDRVDELYFKDHIVVYCRSGKRSKAAQKILKENKFIHISNVLGGFIEYEDETKDI